jgi:hypothetical protein
LPINGVGKRGLAEAGTLGDDTISAALIDDQTFTIT